MEPATCELVFHTGTIDLLALQPYKEDRANVKGPYKDQALTQIT